MDVLVCIDPSIHANTNGRTTDVSNKALSMLQVHAARNIQAQNFRTSSVTGCFSQMLLAVDDLKIRFDSNSQRAIAASMTLPPPPFFFSLSLMANVNNAITASGCSHRLTKRH